jgi:HK97 family phage major capsid protein
VENALAHGDAATITSGTPNRPMVKAREGYPLGGSDAAPSDSEYRTDFATYLRTGIVSKRLAQEMETKAQSEGTTAAGGATVPRDFLAELSQVLADYAPVLKSARRVDAQTNIIDIPRISSHGAAAWTAEAAGYNESDEVFATTSVTIHKATRLVKLSEELVADARVDLDSFLATEFGRSIGALVNTALTVGTGVAQPNGFVPKVPAGQIVQQGTGNTTTIGSSDHFLDVLVKVKPQYRNRPSTAWHMNDVTANIARKMKDTTNRPIWLESLASGEPAQLLGYPVILNPDMASPAASAKSIAFGDFSFYYACTRPEISIQRLDEAFASTGQVGFRAMFRIGADLLVTEALSIGQHSAT